MKTEILKFKEHIDIEKLKKAASLLKNGELVAFPTETVYGLGANALDENAVKKIFVAKGRPSDNPLIVHIDSVEKLDSLVENVSDKAKKIMEKFWPGPLTIIFNKKSIVPSVTTGALETVAIRLPEDEVARKLIEEAGLPIAAPSANISGKPSPTKCKHVIADLDGKISMIICRDNSNVGLESTVLDLTSDIPMILRPGAITYEMLKDVISEVEFDPAIYKDVKPKSPGMKYTHYSPNAEVIVFVGEKEKKIKEIKSRLEYYKKLEKKVAVMATEELIKEFKGEICLSMSNEMNDVAKKLFYLLRKSDELGVDIVLAEGFKKDGIGHAIMNRLEKAASNNIIYLD